MKTIVLRFAGKVVRIDPESGEACAEFPGIGERGIIPLALPKERHGNLKEDREDIPFFYTLGEMVCERIEPPEMSVGMYIFADVAETDHVTHMVVRWRVASAAEYENFIDTLDD